MATEQYIGEIRAVSFNFAPTGWIPCDGRTLPRSQYQALYSLIGNIYGGDGTNTFCLPNLQGRTPVHSDNGMPAGQTAGSETVTLTTSQSPHTHLVSAKSAAGNTNAPANNVPGGSTAPAQAYGATPDTAMNTAIVGQTGQSQPHNNIQPSLVVNYIIAFTGIFPTRT